MYLAAFLLSLFLAIAHANYENHRLPLAVQPQHYDLRILTHLNQPEQLRFEGLVKIRLIAIEPSNSITLHARNLTIDESHITLSSLGSINSTNCIRNIELDTNYDLYTMHLCEPLLAGVETELTIRFAGRLNANMTGYYKSSYEEPKTNEKIWLALTQFSPDFARLAFPCFDEPNFKATFNITLGYHKQYTGLSNMPIRKCEPNPDLENYVWCEHEKLLKTSTYLVAYSVHNLIESSTIVSNTKRKTKFRNWVKPGATANFTLQFGPEALTYLEGLFDISFPLAKIDQLIAPNHKYTAMEHWGLVTFEESKFLDGENNQQWREDRSSTIAHEYAHQWFGNLVTMKWWSNVWLKEGWSTYLGYLTVDHLNPTWDYATRQTYLDLSPFLFDDALKEAPAISRPIQKSSDIFGNNRYVYKKGGLTARMLHKILGNETFYAGVRKFLHRHIYANADEGDLWQAFGEAAHEHGTLPTTFNLSTAMSTWTLQGGYPLLSVNRDYAAGTATVNQSQFLLNDGKAGESAADNCWWVPLSYVSQSEINFERAQPSVWLECPRAVTVLSNMPRPDQWILLNPQLNTIYRVNYDDRNWQLIRASLVSGVDIDRIHVLNKAQLIDDVMMLAWNGLRNYELALGILQYLPHERDYLPWQAAIDNLVKLGNLLRDSSYASFKVYMRKFLAPLCVFFSGLDTEGLETLQPSQVLLHKLIHKISMEYDVKACVPKPLKFLTDDIRMALEDSFEDSTVPVDFRADVLCTVVAQSNELNFQLIMNRLKNSSTPYITRSKLSNAIGCTKDFMRMKEFFDFSLNSDTKWLKNKYLETLAPALRSNQIRIEARDYFFDILPSLAEKFSADKLRPVFKSLPYSIESVEDCTYLKNKLEGYNMFDELIKGVLKLCMINLEWKKKRSNEFYTELIKYV